MLVIYDERNLQFFGDEEAARLWETASQACRRSGLFRRVTWQRLA